MKEFVYDNFISQGYKDLSIYVGCKNNPSFKKN